jgi:hypothetical protein
MEAPHQYPYNPPVWLILLSFGSGFAWMAVDWLPLGHAPTGFKLWFSLIGLIPVVWSLILGVRWISAERYLLLDRDSMVLPIGWLAIRTAKIEYTRIKRVWRHYVRPYEHTYVLKVATEEQAFTILPAFLPDQKSRRGLEEFLNRRLLENARAKNPPKAD